MDSKEQLIKLIQDWVKLDNEMRMLQKEIKKRKDEKKNNSERLMETMKKHEIDCFDLKDGQICYVKKNVKKPITKKILMGILSKYYKGDLAKANELNNFIIENREDSVKETIERKLSKTTD